MMLLLYVALRIILRGDLYCLALRFVFFSPFSVAIFFFGEERVGLYAFVHLFVLHLMVCVSFLFLLVSGIGCDL